MPETNSLSVDLLAIDALSQTDRERLEDFLDPDVKMSVVVNRDLPAQTLVDQMELCCRAYVATEKAHTKLKFLVGQFIIAISQHPEETWQSWGYRTYDHFMTEGMPSRFGVSRAEAYKAVRMAEVLGHLKLGEMESIGLRKAHLLSSKSVAERVEELLPSALDKGVTYSEFRDIAFGKDDSLREEYDRRSLASISVAKGFYDNLMGYLANEAVQANFGTTDFGQILEYTLADMLPEIIERAEAEFLGRAAA